MQTIGACQLVSCVDDAAYLMGPDTSQMLLNWLYPHKQSCGQALEQEQAAQTSAQSKSWFRSTRGSQPGLFRRKGDEATPCYPPHRTSSETIVAFA